MSSEHTPLNVIRISQPVILHPHDGETHPASQSQEGHPFSSRQGSPSRYASDVDTGAVGNILPTTMNPHPPFSASVDRHGDYDRESVVGMQDSTAVGAGQPLPLPPLPIHLPEGIPTPVRRQRTTDTRMSAARRSNIDWIVPVDNSEKGNQPLTVKERLAPTLENADKEKEKYARKAQLTSYALNAAIGLQVVLGSLTTGLSAVAATGGGKSAAVQTTILGGLTTVVASYLARMRGSNEPDLSIRRVKDLEQFIRECKAFELDHGHVIGSEFDKELLAKRHRFEELLGNTIEKQKPSPPGAPVLPV